MYTKQLNTFWYYSSTGSCISASDECNSFVWVINLSHTTDKFSWEQGCDGIIPYIVHIMTNSMVLKGPAMYCHAHAHTLPSQQASPSQTWLEVGASIWSSTNFLLWFPLLLWFLFITISKLLKCHGFQGHILVQPVVWLLKGINEKNVWF